MLSFDNTKIAFQSKTDGELKQAHWLFKMISNPALVVFGKYATQFANAIHFPIGIFLRNNVFKQFCGGESIPQCAQTTKVLDEHNIGTILDYSVEGKEKEEVFEHTKNEILKTIATAHNNEHIPFSVFKVSGIARLALLEKVNEGKSLSAAEEQEFENVKNRINELCQAAHATGTPIFIDAEETWMQDVIDEIVTHMMEKYNKEKAIVFNTIQMYRWDRLDHLKEAVAKAKKEHYFYGIKIVRGAYMEKENERAEKLGYKTPIQPDKKHTDDDYDASLRFCIKNIDAVSVCAGSHNEKSAEVLVQLLDEFGVSKTDKRVYSAQLLGMSDHISFNMADVGYNVAKYVPFGPIREVIPYLIRRAEENTSVKGQTGRELSLIKKEIKRRKLNK